MIRVTVGAKRCSKCGLTKAVSDFSRCSAHKDGLQYYCKACQARYDRSPANRAAHAQYDRSPAGSARSLRSSARYNRSAAGRAVQARRDRQRRYWFPEKIKAHSAVQHALETGRLVRQPCEVCGAKRVQAHHDDYSKLLEVNWLCLKDHRQRDKELRRS